jgi:hypothetical protein
MKALSGVDRVWSGARAPQEGTKQPARPTRYLASGGRIGLVTSQGAPAAAATPAKPAKPAKRAASPANGPADGRASHRRGAATA